MIDPSKPLRNARHERFCQLVVSGWSRRDAYSESFDRPVPSEMVPLATLDNDVWRLGQNDGVRARMEWMQSQAAERAIQDGARVLRELVSIGLVSASDLFDRDGRLIHPSHLPPNVAAAISSVEVDEYGKVKVKLWDKLGALEKLGRHLGIFEKDNAQKTDPIAALGKAIVEAAKTVGPGGLEIDFDDE